MERIISHAHKYQHIRKFSSNKHKCYFSRSLVLNANNCWHFNIHEQEISFSAELSMHFFHNLEAKFHQGKQS